MRALAIAAVLACAPLAAGAGNLGVAWNANGSSGSRPIATAPPFAASGPVLAGGANTTLRYFRGTVYAVSRSAGTVTAIAPATWTAIRSYAVGSEPVDVAVVSPTRAYVTRVPLGALADADGIPDLGTMAVYAGRLFVQVRRLNADGPFGQAPPAYLAVVDLATETLVDTEPGNPGVQALRLQGTAPKGKMQIVASTRRLFVCASGGDFDAGGIERIDLDSLQSLGLVIAEADGQTGSDLHAFVLTSPTRGFLAYTTDLTLSSHLTTFTVGSPADPGELIAVVDYAVPALAHDRVTNVVFMPDGSFGAAGVRAFDAASGAQLTSQPSPTAGPPTDLALLCDCADPVCSLEAQCPSGPLLPYDYGTP